mmetsp:Transcript_30760/g.84500  ORF Transcript_30760/g.84500 Transcript_30760/m.84500 type:complete len:100 (+) Transcript_30760:506-805(+)
MELHTKLRGASVKRPWPSCGWHRRNAGSNDQAGTSEAATIPLGRIAATPCEEDSTLEPSQRWATTQPPCNGSIGSKATATRICHEMEQTVGIDADSSAA